MNEDDPVKQRSWPQPLPALCLGKVAVIPWARLSGGVEHHVATDVATAMVSMVVAVMVSGLRERKCGRKFFVSQAGPKGLPPLPGALCSVVDFDPLRGRLGRKM